MDVHGPYKATKLWNDIIRTFRTSMPVGRHRKGVRVFENCFCASDAVEWLQLHLSKNPNFGSDVGRHQIVQLLGKFHKSGVFHDVRGGDKYNSEPFEDASGRLFKFSLVETTLSPLSAQQPKPQPSAMDRAASRRSMRAPPSQAAAARKSQSPLVDCATPVRQTRRHHHQQNPSHHQQNPSHHQQNPSHHQQNPIHHQQNPSHHQQRQSASSAQSPLEFAGDDCWDDVQDDSDDLAYVWLDSALTRLRELLELRSSEELIDSRLLRAEFVRANLTGRPGPDPADSLPDWVANAVRCLARWPDTGMRSLPSYEGFELDIFAALCEFFEGRDSEPLVPCELRDLFVNVLALSDNLAGARAQELSPPQQQQRRCRGHHRAAPAPAMTTSCAEIMRQIALPWDNGAAAGPAAPPRQRCRRHRSSCGGVAGSRYRRGCQSDCEPEATDVDDPRGDGDGAASASASAPIRWRLLRRSAASEADGLGRGGGGGGGGDFAEDDGGGGIHPIDSDSLLASGLQLAALFLQPGRRRRLHQLLRAMHKLGANERLRLDPMLPTPHVILHSLAACALRKSSSTTGASVRHHHQQQQPDVFALQLVAFMTAHYSLIFRPPQELREAVEARLADMRSLRLPRQMCGASGSGGGGGGGGPAPPLPEQRQFCSRIPAEQFSLSGRLTSDQALLGLLEGLLRDENLPAREKRRKLRLFKESHPHVYSARFPDAEVERSMLDSLRGPRGLLGRTLTALRNWRL